jgi:predicted patatin/cPLA2 family phospholipase
MNFSIRMTSSKQFHGPRLSYRRLGLVCQGGGQRGIFTAGVLDAFMKEAYFPFHTMIGVSAGAQNLSAYACDAHGYSRHAIIRHTTHRAFYSPIRFARGGHLVDLDWYLDTVHADVPLNVEQGRDRLSGRALYLCASRRDTLAPAYLPFQEDNLRQVIKASSAIPIFYRGNALVDGIDYWDGAVADALPVRAAYERGCDCIVVIRTTPREEESSPFRLSRNLEYERLKGLAAVVARHIANYSAARCFIEHPPHDVNVVEIAPRHPLRSRLLGSEMNALRHDYRQGVACGRAFIAHFATRLHGLAESSLSKSSAPTDSCESAA